MKNTYTWNINQLTAKIHEDGLDNVIYLIAYSYFATDSTVEPKIMVSTNGSCSVQYNEGDPFIPYDELTKDIVVGWLLKSDQINVEGMQEYLDSQIEIIKNPVDENLYPDWDSPMPPN